MAERPRKERDRIGVVLKVFYVLMLVASVFLVCRIIYIQAFWKPDPDIEKRLTQPVTKVVLEPARGNIMACDGRLLAMTYPRYQIVMDPCVRKDEFAKMDEEDRVKAETEWRDSARVLCNGLAEIFPGKTADEYYNTIISGRNNGKRYLKIGKPIEREDYNYLKSFSLFKKGRYKGGIWAESIPTRRNPYGRLAYRTVGFVRSADIAGVDNRFVGLEGKYDGYLRGKPGVMYLKATDEGPIRDTDSTYREAENGSDIRTTLDIDLLDLCDRALREQIDTVADIESACCVLMEVKTGAIRAMVNLTRDPEKKRTDEVSNNAIGHLFEPGSVFKITTLTTVLEDGYHHSLDETIPSNHGKIEGYKYEQDQHVVDFERKNKTNQVDLLWGVSHSSNYVFRYLGITHYAKEPQKLIDRLYQYGLGDKFDFDLDGLRTPYIPSPKSPTWSKTDLGQIAMGYSVSVTPLHVLTFYNALANDGKMMKPYLVEDIERDGVILEQKGPVIMNAAICSKATADTVTRGLRTVTEEGTARRLKGAKYTVAGKTGTSFGTFPDGHYHNAQGQSLYQGTFVGFFPAGPDDEPMYSIVCSVFTRPTKHSFQGGGLPAAATRTIVDGIYNLNTIKNETVKDNK